MNTSNNALKSLQSVLPALRKQVFDVIYGRGEFGATAQEVEDVLKLERSTVSARFSELKADIDIVSSGKTRKTRSGRNAKVYVAAGLSR